MNVLFEALGLLAGYVVMAVLSGAVYAKSAVRGRTFRRMDQSLSEAEADRTAALLPLAFRRTTGGSRP